MAEDVTGMGKVAFKALVDLGDGSDGLYLFRDLSK
jgi:hypothetical protein